MDYTSQFNQLYNSICHPEISASKRQIVSVNGVQEARNYFLNRGENIILRDANEDIIYVKVCDDAGKCTLKVYQCKDITDKALSSITPQKEDIKNIKEEIAEIKKLLLEVTNGKHNAQQSESNNELTTTVQNL